MADLSETEYRIQNTEYRIQNGFIVNQIKPLYYNMLLFTINVRRKIYLLIYTVALQVLCAYTVALQEYYAHWLGVVKQRGIPKKQSFYEDPHWK